MIARLLLALPLVPSLALAGALQDDVAEAPAPTPAERVVAALEAFGGGEYVLAGDIEKVEPETEDAGFGGVHARVIVAGGGPGGGPGADFTGPFSVWRTPQQEVVIVSHERLPGVAVYDDGDRRISRVTGEEGAPGAGRLSTDVLGLLDVRRLAKSVAKAELQVSVDETTGRMTASGPVSKRLIRGGDGMMAFMEPQVLKIGAMFVLSGEGELEAMTFSVLRSDPMAAMRRDALSGELEGEGGAVVRRSVGGMPQVSDEPGATWIYTLRRAESPPPRAAGFHREVREILSSEEY